MTSIQPPFLESVREGGAGVLLVMGIVITVSLAFGMAVLERPLKTSGHGIVDFEFAGRTGAPSVVRDWDRGGVLGLAKVHLLVDVLFILAYSTTFALLCAGAAEAVRARGWTVLATIGALLAWGQWLAGSLDIVENVALWRTLDEGGQGAGPQIALSMASLKFGLIGLGLLYGGIGALFGLRAGPGALAGMSGGVRVVIEIIVGLAAAAVGAGALLTVARRLT